MDIIHIMILLYLILQVLIMRYSLESHIYLCGQSVIFHSQTISSVCASNVSKMGKNFLTKLLYT